LFSDEGYLILTALALLLGGVGQARAEFIITFSQDGANVDANGTGSINLTGLTPIGTNLIAAQVWPSAGMVKLGPLGAFTSFDAYVGLTGPTSFGPGGKAFPYLGDGHEGQQSGPLSRRRARLVRGSPARGEPHLCPRPSTLLMLPCRLTLLP
jgi:hypothetical protein